MDSSALTVTPLAFDNLMALGTPPHTPYSEVQPSVPSSAPSLRTPRKLQHPQRSTVSESKMNSVIVSFRLVQQGDLPVPSLSVSTQIRVPPAKRRLFASDYDTVEYSDIYIKEQKFPRLSSPPRGRVQKSKCSPTQSEMDGTDADDEMDQTGFPSIYLSPPYSPTEESSATDVSPPQNLNSFQSQRNSVPVVSITPKVKTCASCKTKKTPLWRDSDDGTPYCNACGIRFKKYHVRCSACYYIPRKDEKVNNSCCLCGSRLVHCRHH